jgi:hypothetical protein
MNLFLPILPFLMFNHALVWCYHKLYDEKQHPISELCDMLGISKTALYGYLKRRNSGE